MKILILDNNLQQVSLLSNYVSLNWNRQFACQGSFEISANLNTINVNELQVGRLVYLDSERIGIIERIEVTRETDMSGEILTATGIELKDITNRRITIPPDGVERQEYVSMTTESIVRDLLDKNIVNPVDELRKISFLELGKTNCTDSNTKDFSTRYKPLSEEITNLLQESMLGLVSVTDLENKNVSLEVRCGMDRTIEQNINPRAIFSLKLGTSNQSVVLHDAQSFRNTAYVGDDGEGVARNITVIPAINTKAGIDRREVFVDARDAATTDEITTRGKTKLAELGQVYQVESVASSGTVISYDLGDLVTVMDYRSGEYENLQITGIVDTYAGAAPMQRSIVFGRAPLNIGQAINSRLSGVNNILTQ